MKKLEALLTPTNRWLVFMMNSMAQFTWKLIYVVWRLLIRDILIIIFLHFPLAIIGVIVHILCDPIGIPKF